MDNDEFDKRKYENVIAGYTDYQIVCETAIIEKQESILYSKKKALKDEYRRRLEAGR